MLLTPDYKKTLEAAHTINPSWGRGGLLWKDEVIRQARAAQAHHLIDYGCGKGAMVAALREDGFAVQGYDPGNAEFMNVPKRGDFLYSLDVLEHIEPDCLESVLAHIAGLAPQAFLVISMKAAKQILPDGRNAHLIIEGEAFWAEKLRGHYAHVATRTGQKNHELVAECFTKYPGEA